ncbi:PREDICTED: zinc transporter 7-A isoform X2 [Nelumbo nucifera]|uniref:Cation efflux protein transmembrane domain-containing protein n=2 Tax=Nelumbo nucifera TaxID=4432 RepID=A0A822YFW7_NELNU|nr:PREDICTED: zinc transporter 7-A isoform X2 [Nelumbo nucifera]DAD31063.1 TPA_asm: hypothetical protein HUJ06_009914 [Nelumbo nucifera]
MLQRGSSPGVGIGILEIVMATWLLRVWPMLLPFLSGFLGCYERLSMNWGSIRQLGRKRVRLISLFFTTVVLFFPAAISFLMFEEEGYAVSLGNLGWPLANTVIFGVLLSENYGDEKLTNPKDFQRDFLVTFACTLVLELFYFPELSLWGLLFCGLLLWVSVRQLDPAASSYPELGSDSSESFSSMITKPIRHILSERKSRKIALFLLINTAYMVVEFVAGFMSNSLGLISDACHMLFDCAALAIGLYASYISRLPANNQFNFGRGRFEVLSGYVNAVFLVLVGALIVLESFERILDPQEISTSSLLTVSIGGLVVNVVGLIFFHEEHHHAHGGAGSCSHSHPHSHSNHHHHHHSHDHVLENMCHDEHHECISVSHESSEKSSSTAHNHHAHSNNCGDKKIGRSTCSHDHHCSDHQHNHHDHASDYDQHNHTDQHDHHGHHHHSDHDHHNDTDKLDHYGHHHHHASPQACGSSTIDSKNLQNHLLLDNEHGKSQVHRDSCSHRECTSSHTHAQKSDFHSHSTSGNDGKLKESSSKGKIVEEPQKHHHHHIDHNMEGIFLHVLADTMGSFGVVISTLLIKYKGWLIADPACSIFISLMIVSSVVPLLRNSAEILLQRVPRAHEQDLKVALDDITRINGVQGIQNLHVWSFTNTDVVGTLHLHISAETDKAFTKAQVTHILHDAGVKDLTIQVEHVK